jgi:hypothetical protein
MTRLEIIGWGEVSGRGAWFQPCRKALIGSIQCGTKVEPEISPLRYALSKNISADPSWKYFSTERSGVERSPVSRCEEKAGRTYGP